MKRAIRTVIRLIAAGAIVIGGMDCGLEVVRRWKHFKEVSLWVCIINFLVIVAGVILFVASAALAEKFADDFDE